MHGASASAMCGDSKAARTPGKEEGKAGRGCRGLGALEPRARAAVCTPRWGVSMFLESLRGQGGTSLRQALSVTTAEGPIHVSPSPLMFKIHASPALPLIAS